MEINQARQLVQQAVYEALKNLDEITISPEQVQQMVEIPKNSQLGDFAFPTFRLAKQLRQAPVKIAQNLAKEVDSSQFAQVCAQGPYVNFFLQRKDIAATTIEEVIKQKNNFGNSTVGANSVVTIDMSSPNIAKPMSMGHLRSTVIGNSIALILDKLNYHPVKINHPSD